MQVTHIRPWVLAASLVVSLGACKKSEEAPAPIASATAETTAAPAPTPPEAPTPAEPAATATATASAEPTPAASAAEPAPKATAAATDSDGGATTADKKVSAAALNGIKACCSAIANAAGKDPANAKRYQAAAVTCLGLTKSLATGKANPSAARTTLRAQLQGVPMPGGC